MSITRKALANPAMQSMISVARKLWFAGRHERVTLGGHRLRYVPGSRPTRLKYRDDPDLIVRNDVRQLEYFCENVRDGETVLDVGANYGQYAVLFAALVGPRGKVVSFEPEPAARDVLERNIAINGFRNRVTVEPLAVFDSAGTHEFFTRPDDSMSSLERAGFGTNSDAADIVQLTVQTVTLDDYLASKRLSEPDWLKIDAEGAEVNVLRGASRVLNSRTKIVCELHPYAWESFGTTYDDLTALVRHAGRELRLLDPSAGASTDGLQYGAIVIE